MIANTFILGAMKSATTSLCDILGQHRDAFICCPKEPDFFSRDEVYARGIDWYASLFRGAAGSRVAGDGSTSYTKQLQYPHAAQRLALHAPQARLIYMARRPLERIQSHWAHEVLKGRTRLDLEPFVRSHPEAIDASCYWRQINRYRDHFPEDRILVLFFEDYTHSVQGVVDQCTDFLGLTRLTVASLDVDRNQTSARRRDIAPIRLLRQFRWFDLQMERTKRAVPKSVQRLLKQVLKSNTGAGPPQWSPELRAWVLDQLAADNQRFLAAYGRPADFWQRNTTDTPDLTQS
jgi:hypothetical protein